MDRLKERKLAKANRKRQGKIAAKKPLSKTVLTGNKESVATDYLAEIGTASGG